jgi:hypothetical protein
VCSRIFVLVYCLIGVTNESIRMAAHCGLWNRPCKCWQSFSSFGRKGRSSQIPCHLRRLDTDICWVGSRLLFVQCCAQHSVSTILVNCNILTSSRVYDIQGALRGFVMDTSVGSYLTLLIWQYC